MVANSTGVLGPEKGRIVEKGPFVVWEGREKCKSGAGRELA
jgi:hypothetical protein